MNRIKLIITVLTTLVSFAAIAEPEPTHKHNKATMSGESHSEHMKQEKPPTEEATPAQPTHKHHKVTMPEASHSEYVKSQENRDRPEMESNPDETESDMKTHKHNKATMSGEKHNP